jgi:hypothetical protein
MASFRLTVPQIKAIHLEDKKTWPIDLQVWVELSVRHSWRRWDAPFYLSTERVQAFQKLIRQLIKEKTTVRRSSASV